MWCVPTIDDEFETRMMDVLECYAKPSSVLFPVVCIDEKSVELHAERHKPIPHRAGLRRDHQYVRRGTANVFVATEPRGGRHFARVTKRRTKKDFARFMHWLQGLYPEAIRIHVIMDNLNTHNESSLIETYGEDEGRRIWRRFVVHYTPKHASWLNQAEIALSMMARGCLGKRRIPTIQGLRKEVTAFWRDRRKEGWTIDWRFTTTQAKTWLKSFGT